MGLNTIGVVKFEQMSVFSSTFFFGVSLSRGILENDIYIYISNAINLLINSLKEVNIIHLIET